MKKIVISIVLLNLLAACASQKPQETAATPASSPVAAAPAVAMASSAQTYDDALNDPQSILAKRSVYYPFDVSEVQDADKPVVQAHGAYLSKNPARTVRLEGNCDERGSNEYNLALGQRRADGVKKMLELGGAKSAQLDSVSYGEEKPVGSTHDEASWAKNRRTDINYAK
ncbi:MAG: peptidoglycan-associated lipoprotein [Gallionellales bacterium CG_4_10_14_3_um_filter_54_96]|nr:peptidoglycan-associated lipoprotein Pal [Gallionella sp.]PIV15639.1 MAG: peptidoglycan-associated lipoprotein [Gallionellales bacterium CG03_land_8_20_14_0_80_55_15]PIV91339.1 MAG: peptidoglycan-associated lipoprotein [Gallionellales bacterium CG17_big_fil_post_rev_8_21_14_2_50_54_146]PIX04751.1 MAG: peptidoglycan-associated lipoprotein [Gallionellales bacterium CG_4_8_14_3_um_filter_54_18]PIY07030.1 MAG: peptidoglycan-associated lipoprotein [Gallionellales bacterium CG_4_10_14_3_um_filter_